MRVICFQTTSGISEVMCLTNPDNIKIGFGAMGGVPEGYIFPLNSLHACKQRKTKITQKPVMVPKKVVRS